MKENKQYSEVLEQRLSLLGLITDQNYETKKTQNHDGIGTSKKQENKTVNAKPTLLISFDSENETKCNELKQRLVNKFNVGMINIEGIFNHYLIYKTFLIQNHPLFSFI